MNSFFVAPNLLLYSILVATILVYVPYLLVAYERVRLAMELPEPMAVFSQPRAMASKLPNYAQRAGWAHQNGFESLALYAPAAIMGYVVELTSGVAVAAALAYLLARSLYSLFYVLDLPPLRSLMFGVGSLSIGTLYLLSCRVIWGA